jgi:phage tail sheath gpL-like
VLNGQTQQFKALGTYSNTNSTTTLPLDITNIVAWKSLTPAAATINSLTGLATAVAAGGSLTLFANNPGQWGNNLRLSVNVQPNNNRFSLLVQQAKPNGQLQTLENFVNLSVFPADPQYAVTVIDNDSNYITFVNPANDTAPTLSLAPAPTSVPVALNAESMEVC